MTRSSISTFRNELHMIGLCSFRAAGNHFFTFEREMREVAACCVGTTACSSKRKHATWLDATTLHQDVGSGDSFGPHKQGLRDYLRYVRQHSLRPSYTLLTCNCKNYRSLCPACQSKYDCYRGPLVSTPPHGMLLDRFHFIFLHVQVRPCLRTQLRRSAQCALGQSSIVAYL